MIALWESDISSILSYDHILVFSFQGQQETRFLVIVVNPFQPEIRILTARAATVLCSIKEPGGTLPVILPT